MHISVLLNESIEGLNIKEDGIYVDSTLGYAGHSSEILKRIKKGFLFAIDQDSDAIKYSMERLSKINDNFEIIHTNFKNIKEELNKRNIYEVDGIIFDLGVSSVQLDDGERGFSYHQDAKLDMRMDKESNFSAINVVNEYSEKDLTRIIRDYGEEKFASSIARNIVKYRNNKRIETTFELVDIISNSLPMKAKRDKHPARKTFQAIRIEVNHELDILEDAMKDALSLLRPGGRLAVITFHSLEDRIVKQIFKKESEVDDLVKGRPEIPKEYEPRIKLINKKPILPSEQEIKENSRSKSAKLRIIERVWCDMANKQVKKQKRLRKILHGERAIYLTLALILLAIPVCNVYTKAILSESNIALEEKKSEIRKQEDINDSLKMEISELASLDTIQNVATEYGLTYQNENIKVVTND